MTFYHTAEDIHIDDGHVLKARLQKADGEWEDAEIDLNNHIGNDNGNFVWDGENFSESAEDIHFALEGDGDVPVLRATLMDVEGNGQARDLNLGERISNQDGSFCYGEHSHSGID
ncbi:cyanovirin-n family protein [Stemphylium lycopersici]|uniref:Cyanovirin-n family protein n=1 Tax=Stemphylium lycopersici TaxID=183478 RepID=A0A364N4A2_STELY|nr:cyanovirin-n family protein [Stemphylium lycopersici]RAR11455.1 cyanovirin-n family protein [Stemphylium lycopersici]